MKFPSELNIKKLLLILENVFISLFKISTPSIYKNTDKEKIQVILHAAHARMHDMLKEFGNFDRSKV